MAEDNVKRLTYFQKKTTKCPVCESEFFKEEMHSGRGRLIAGELTDELHRLYEPSQKFGEVYPLVYSMVVCPHCLYSAFPKDFLEIEKDTAKQIEHDNDRRIRTVHKIFPELDFTSPRGLEEGTASYYLGMLCYEFFPKEIFAPSFKQGLCTLRGGWLAKSLHERLPGENYDYLAKVLYRKAAFLYNLAVEREQNGEEPLPADFNYGPDTDKNYGYDGVLFLAGLLQFRYGQQENRANRKEKLEAAKTNLAKIFGMGKASKDKPAAILDKSKDIYSEIKKELANEE